MQGCGLVLHATAVQRSGGRAPLLVASFALRSAREAVDSAQQHKGSDDVDERMVSL